MSTHSKSGSLDPAVNITAWLFMIITVFSVTSRLGTKFYLFKKLMIDDILILVSMVFSIGHVIAVSMAVSYGYGYHYPTIPSEKRDQIMKVCGQLRHIYVDIHIW